MTHHVEHPILRTRFELRLPTETRWYDDRALLEAVVAPVARSELSSALTHGGVYGAARRLTRSRRLETLLGRGDRGAYQALDAAKEVDANLSVSFDLTDDGVDVCLMVGAAQYRARAATLLDEVESIGVGLFSALRSHGFGLAHGFAHPMARGVYAYPMTRPPVSHFRLSTIAVLELFDRDFHQSTHDDALGAEVEALIAAPVPASVMRSERSGLTVMRWIGDLRDDLAVARAAGRHESWMSRSTHVRRPDRYSAQGDLRVDVAKGTRAPFTFFDEAKRAGYKAILVHPDGTPDATVWAEVTRYLAHEADAIDAVWLVAPLRELALGLTARARAAGFAGVLYPEGGHLWNPSPPGWWIDDEPAETAAAEGR